MTVKAGSDWISGSHLVSLQDTHFTFEHQVETQLFILQKMNITVCVCCQDLLTPTIYLTYDYFIHLAAFTHTQSMFIHIKFLMLEVPFLKPCVALLIFFFAR